jgi:hypothetical protein
VGGMRNEASVQVGGPFTGRSVIYVDAENVLGSHRRCPPTCWNRHLVGAVATAKLSTADQVVVACGPTLALAAGLALPGARLLVGRGVDGADGALIGDIEPEWVSSRFDRVALLSGDGIFTEPVEALRRNELRVVVFALRRAASLRLLGAASAYAFIDGPEDHPVGAARGLRKAA